MTNESLVSHNHRTVDAKNLTVSQFHDQESDSSTNQNNEIDYDYVFRTIDQKDYSVWTTANDSAINSGSTLNNSLNGPNNMTVDGFHDQESV
jgi:hypothetical protein